MDGVAALVCRPHRVGRVHRAAAHPAALGGDQQLLAGVAQPVLRAGLNNKMWSAADLGGGEGDPAGAGPGLHLHLAQVGPGRVAGAEPLPAHHSVTLLPQSALLL